MRPSISLPGSLSIGSGLSDTSNGSLARLTIRTSSRGESWMLTLRTHPSRRNSHDYFLILGSESASEAPTEYRKFHALRDARAFGFSSGRRNFFHHRPHETIPSRMGPLQLRRRPSAQIAQAQRDTGRSAHPHVAVDDDALRTRPGLDEPSDRLRVLLRKENVGGLAALGDVVEVKPKNRDEFRRHSRRFGIRIGDGDADFARSARLIRFGVFAREHQQLRGAIGSLPIGRSTGARHSTLLSVEARLRSVAERLRSAPGGTTRDRPPPEWFANKSGPSPAGFSW